MGLRIHSWQKITRELVQRQTAWDRLDVTYRVFKAKLTVLMDLIRQGHFFDAEHPVVDEKLRY